MRVLIVQAAMGIMRLKKSETVRLHEWAERIAQRRGKLFEKLREHLGPVFRKLAEQKDSRVEEGHIMLDHVHMRLSIPPKLSVSLIVGYIKGKSAIHIARMYEGKQRSYVGHHFWARGVLRADGGSGQEADPRVHPQPGERR